MTKGEAVNWLTNIMADIGKIEHQELWHYEQALTEIRDIMQDEMNDAMPTYESNPADLVRVVRCKDCKYYPHRWSWVSCPMTGKDTRKPEDYCSYGERKNEESI